MELALKGSLYSILQGDPPSYKKLSRIFAQTALAISHLHSLNIIHRDLKPENILLDQNLNAKVCDFGMAASGGPGICRSTFCGTYEYMAPEVFEGEGYGGEADIWSLGVLLYEIFHGQAPFTGKSVFQIYRKIHNTKLLIRQDVEKDVATLIKSILVLEPGKRPIIDKVLATPFVQKHIYFESFKKKEELDFSNLNLFEEKRSSLGTFRKIKANIQSNKTSQSKNSMKVKSFFDKSASNKQDFSAGLYKKNFQSKSKSKNRELIRSGKPEVKTTLPFNEESKRFKIMDMLNLNSNKPLAKTTINRTLPVPQPRSRESNPRNKNSQQNLKIDLTQYEKDELKLSSNNSSKSRSKKEATFEEVNPYSFLKNNFETKKKLPVNTNVLVNLYDNDVFKTLTKPKNPKELISSLVPSKKVVISNRSVGKTAKKEPLSKLLSTQNSAFRKKINQSDFQA